MKQKGDAQLTITIVVIILFLVAGYFVYKYFIPQINQVIPSTAPVSTQTLTENLPIVTEPKAGAKVASPVTIRGTVPPGWMFEGVFPIKFTDSNHNLIVQGQAKEEVAGSWQSNTPVYFMATLSFSTAAKSGFLILMNDNPSGDPANSKTFEVPITF